MRLKEPRMEEEPKLKGSTTLSVRHVLIHSLNLASLKTFGAVGKLEDYFVSVA